ncbi:MAG: ABC transporter ATP-binding protein [Calditrichaeota bacterium]|nr:ABC transporter ATP-binding protein [Calditrichota bacterium]
MNKILSVQHLTKSYLSGSKQLTVLDDVSFEIDQSAVISIVGPSGSGKTTLLGLCAGLDIASSGTVELNGILLNKLDQDELADVRNQNVGFVFQNFQLMPTLSSLENVMVPAELHNRKDVRDRAVELLEKVGLGDRLNHYPVQLSGGEQQRVSLARAFINEPKILFADEPTGNLDAETSQSVIDLLFELNQQSGTALVLVTHDLDLANKTERIIQLRGGRIASDMLTAAKKEAEA